MLGVFLITISIYRSTEEERNQLYENIIHADLFYVFLSLFCGFSSHLSRAYRWKFLLAPLGYKIKLHNSFMAVMSGYLANLGIPRSGEVLRAASVANYEKIPFEKAFGTIISERVADLIMLLLILSIAFISQTEYILMVMDNYQINPFMGVLALIILFSLGLLFLRLLKKSTIPIIVKVRDFGKGILEGMKSILSMKNKFAFIFHTFFIWGMYLLMFFLIKFAVPGASIIDMGQILVAFVVGSFAISVTNGGIGVYPIAIGAVLALYGINQQTGEAFGWVVWGSQTLLNLIIGGLSIILMPLVNKK
ncbi:lysylphosphatidylglycerol synthase transmembrane domain-containing protein [Mesonia sp.]|uniref:lysylphosphatidylglycerol synthase transmembrane domain-containing protein n=1 Tax=Mesonia sp. TaxID=1960830 RepID=UPI003F9DDC7A